MLLGPFVVVESGAIIGDRTLVYPFCYLGPGVRIGKRCILFPGAVLLEGTQLGDDVLVGPGTVLGYHGFRLAEHTDGTPFLVPHFGGVRVGHGVTVGALCAVDRGLLTETRLGEHTHLDNLVQVGHHSQLGRGVRVAAQTGFAGHARVGDEVWFGGQVGVPDHVDIGPRARFAGKTGIVQRRVPPDSLWAGYPAVPVQLFRRYLMDIPRWIRRLEERIARLERDD